MHHITNSCQHRRIILLWYFSIPLRFESKNHEFSSFSASYWSLFSCTHFSGVFIATNEFWEFLSGDYGKEDYFCSNQVCECFVSFLGNLYLVCSLISLSRFKLEHKVLILNLLLSDIFCVTNCMWRTDCFKAAQNREYQNKSLRNFCRLNKLPRTLENKHGLVPKLDMKLCKLNFFTFIFLRNSRFLRKSRIN